MKNIISKRKVAKFWTRYSCKLCKGTFTIPTMRGAEHSCGKGQGFWKAI